MPSEDELDGQLERLAKRSLERNASSVDVDTAIDAHRARLLNPPARRGTRRYLVAAAALLISVAVGALIATTGADNSRLTISISATPADSPPPATGNPEATVPAGTNFATDPPRATRTTAISAAPQPTGTPTTADIGDATVDSIPPLTSSDQIAVSYLDPPPLYEPQPFAEIAVDTGAAWVALGDSYVVVGDIGRWATEPQPDRVFVVPLDNPADVSTIDVKVAPDAMIAGPGPVIYGSQLQASENGQTVTTRFVAVALAGPNAGNIVSELPGFVHAAEVFDDVYAHGVDGVVDRWADGAFIMPYLDTTGTALPVVDIEWPRYDLINNWPGERPSNDEVIDTATGQTRWALQITRDPDAPSHLEGRAAPGANGTAIRMTWIGPRIGDDIDYGPPTIPVIAALTPDGSGTWYRLPEGWQVADSNKWGTLLMQSTDGITQLAFFDPTTP